VILLVCAASILLTIQHNTVKRLRAESHETESPLPPEPSPTTTSPAWDQQEHEELLRLRNEVAHLRSTSSESLTQIQELSNSVQTLIASAIRNSRKLRALEVENAASKGEPPPLPSGVRTGAWIGIAMQDGKSLTGLTGATNGVVVSHINGNSPADRANLKELDVILKVDGTEVVGVGDLGALIASKTVGRPIILDVMRDKEIIKVEVTPTDWPKPP